MGIELTDVFITLKPRSQWTRAKTQDELTGLIQQSLRELPGQRIAMTQPIEMRLNEMITGIRSDVAVKLFGDDFDVLVDKAEEIEKVLRSIDGSADVAVEQITGQPVLQIKVKQDEIARYGVSAKQVLDLVESLGSFQLGEVYEGQLRFPLVVRLPEQFRSEPGGDRRDSDQHGHRPADSACTTGRHQRGRRPFDDHARMGLPADHHLVQHSRPRHGQLCRRGTADASTRK